MQAATGYQHATAAADARIAAALEKARKPAHRADDQRGHGEESA
jgi:hypothetical protein